MSMKTALAIIQNVKYRTNQPAPSSLVGSTDPDELQMLHLLYAVCEDLRQMRIFTRQKRSHSFATVASTQNYLLPADYYSPLLRTEWNQNEDNPLVGPVSDSQWNWHVYGDVPSTQNYTYRLFGWDENRSTDGGQFYLNPTPSSAQTLSFDYITRHLFIAPDWAASTAYTTSDYVNVNGEMYKCASNGTSGSTPPSGKTTGISDGTATWDWYNTPAETLIADTWLCLFDYDLVELGLLAKYMEYTGGNYQKAEAEYKAKVDRAAARHRGSFVGSFCGRGFSPRYHVPYRSWSI